MKPSTRGGADTSVIEMAMRLSVLLSAGVTVPAAWRHLARDGDAVLVEAARAAESGGDVAAALRLGGGAWNDIARAWAVAVAVGAPLADTLRSAVAALRDAHEVHDDVVVALSEPVATARLLTWLPLLGLPLGIALGLDPLRVVTEPLGTGAVIAGLLLIGVSHVWTRRLARRAEPGTDLAGWEAELVAVALSSGASVDRAQALVAAERGATPSADVPVGITEALDLSVRTGAPAVELLRGEAWLARQRARAQGRETAARLSTRLLLPLGICTLPAFLLLGVVPAVLGVVRSTVLPL
ncbi:type II secretion system F family protein [Microbacterium sp. IEGM 1404]|uniref:type II secretion system F family protein n=1 Tax=Microbacterium sp. IEGM 1404 TaxID=3047084 RepID=UPI0024B7D218|nr:type II secretion system F family protein [Microbacterium sp. IEGM 1404]